MLSIRALKLQQGRFYGLEDQMQRSRVAVIGRRAKEKLFSGRNALGERVRVNGLSFEVIGVLAAKMQEGNDDINRVLYVPFSTMGDLKDTTLSRLYLVYLPDPGVRASGISCSSHLWRLHTNLTSPTARRFASST